MLATKKAESKQEQNYMFNEMNKNNKSEIFSRG
jgi:hypothetical protein